MEQLVRQRTLRIMRTHPNRATNELLLGASVKLTKIVALHLGAARGTDVCLGVPAFTVVKSSAITVKTTMSVSQGVAAITNAQNLTNVLRNVREMMIVLVIRAAHSAGAAPETFVSPEKKLVTFAAWTMSA